MDTDAGVEQILRGNPLFAGLEEDQLASLSREAGSTRLEDGQHLFEHGQAADRFFVVRRGRIKLYRLSPAGNEKVIEIVSPGQSFAEAVMFMASALYPVSAQALGATEVIAIANTRFLELLNASPDTCFRVLGSMSLRLHERLNEIEALTLQNATLRVVNYLRNLYREQDRPANGAICLPAAKHLVASQLSVQPETLSRILHSLSDEGLISVQGLTITIHDIDALRRRGT